MWRYKRKRRIKTAFKLWVQTSGKFDMRNIHRGRLWTQKRQGMNSPVDTTDNWMTVSILVNGWMPARGGSWEHLAGHVHWPYFLLMIGSFFPIDIMQGISISVKWRKQSKRIFNNYRIDWTIQGKVNPNKVLSVWSLQAVSL